MCFKKIKDILFPLNVFGKDRKSIAYDVPGATYYMSVTWIGDRLDLIYCNEDINTGEITETRNTYTIDGGFFQTVINGINYKIPQNKIFFNCTNVTSLIVDGNQLI